MLPNNFNYNKDIINEGVVPDTTVVSCYLPNELVIKKGETSKLYPLLNYVRIEYDYYNQINQKEGLYYCKKEEQNPNEDSRYLVEMNMMLLAANHGDLLSFSNTTLRTSVYSEQRQYLIQSHITAPSLQVRTAIGQERHWVETDGFYSYQRLPIDCTPSGSFSIDVAGNNDVDVKIIKLTIVINDLGRICLNVC